MDSNLKQYYSRMIRLLENMREEVEECQGYSQRSDFPASLRNLEGIKDEIDDLERQWQSLVRDLRNRKP